MCGIEVDVAGDAVLFIGFDNGDGLLAVADEVGEGHVHAGVAEHGFAGGHPEGDFLAFVRGYFPGEVLGIEDGGADDDDGDEGEKGPPV